VQDFHVAVQPEIWVGVSGAVLVPVHHNIRCAFEAVRCTTQANHLVVVVHFVAEFINTFQLEGNFGQQSTFSIECGSTIIRSAPPNITF
jgi:hypothetical protein